MKIRYPKPGKSRFVLKVTKEELREIERCLFDAGARIVNGDDVNFEVWNDLSDFLENGAIAVTRAPRVETL